ncbi:MAG TPA: FAD-dependent oxidoreductase, partial [Polyangia bacterium]|nr:FAD-dependent oxidoreductase [Polyangia bacterium]
MSKTAIVVGAGHNGLVAAVMLAKRGVKVRVLEDKPVIGGAVRTERPFKKAPGLATSTGAYLLGLMPPEIMAATGVSIPVMRRDPHYFLPTTEKRYLLFGSDQAAMKRQFIDFFSEQDWRANQAMNDEIGKIRDDIARTWMEEPLSIEDTAERYVRKELRQAFVNLCRKPVGEYIDRWGFKSDLVRAMYAVTDGFSGLYGSWDTPGTGMNFLIHNMCRLPGSDGTWMIVKGGMGTVTRMMAEKAQEHGATIEVNKRVETLRIDGGPGGGR